MKRFFRSSLSIFLALTIIFSSAYIGLNEIDLSSLMVIKAKAASSGTCGDNLTWTLDNNGTLTISGTGDMADYSGSDSSRPWNSEISKIKSIVFKNGITSISFRAFANCTNLLSVTFCNTLTDIGWASFNACRSLTSVSIPDSVKKIQSYAFASCSNLITISLPSNATSIGAYVFASTAYFNNTENWDDNALYIDNYLIAVDSSVNDDFRIKPGTKLIADYTFSECNNLKTITIPDGVKYIGMGTFYECENLSEVVIYDSVNVINEVAFYNCPKLNYVFFTGTRSEWSKVYIGSYNNDLHNAIMHYETDTHTISDWIIDSAATCTTVGLKHKECTVCKEVFGIQEIEITGHSISDWIIDSTATCTTTGLKYKECTKCKVIFETQEIEKEEHSVSDWIVDSVANCTTVGLKHKECTECGEVFVTEAIEATGHSLSDWITDKNATCIATGSKHKECTECGEVLETTTIAKVSHTASSWKTDKKATVTSAGSKHKECTKCGKVLETAKIAQLKCSKPKLSKIENTADGVKITWGKVSGADKYYVYRKTSGGSYSRIGSISKTGYTDKTAKSGEKYYYIVKAINEAGASSSSSSLSKLYLADPTLKTPSSSKTGIKLTWNKISGSDGYMVYRKTGTGSYTRIATVKGSTKVTYTDKSAKKGKKYTYKVKAYKSKTYSAYSNTKTITDKY